MSQAALHAALHFCSFAVILLSVKLQGQFVDHDLVGTVDPPPSGHKYEIPMTKNGQTAVMRLDRVVSDEIEGTPCRSPKSIQTPLLDAGPVYGTDEDYLQVRSCVLLAHPLLSRDTLQCCRSRLRCHSGAWGLCVAVMRASYGCAELHVRSLLCLEFQKGPIVLPVADDERRAYLWHC